ncbi:MAG: hypothetical protein A3I78_00725 [Gammaproteobacteria bacterium RIFCSPLOWO2_02_FULL_56_15]|nr:MAG: hypothetical protein A3I78_00725 [Gammaproteobacteria bacterium RIFCSPLOWO2_02_FULL_56_15]
MEQRNKSVPFFGEINPSPFSDSLCATVHHAGGFAAWVDPAGPPTGILRLHQDVPQTSHLQVNRADNSSALIAWTWITVHLQDMADI